MPFLPQNYQKQIFPIYSNMFFEQKQTAFDIRTHFFRTKADVARVWFFVPFFPPTLATRKKAWRSRPLCVFPAKNVGEPFKCKKPREHQPLRERGPFCAAQRKLPLRECKPDLIFLCEQHFWFSWKIIRDGKCRTYFFYWWYLCLRPCDMYVHTCLIAGFIRRIFSNWKNKHF
jgi:hypothetical protein